MRIISIILSIIALIGSAYSYGRTSKALKKLKDYDIFTVEVTPPEIRQWEDESNTDCSWR